MMGCKKTEYGNVAIMRGDTPNMEELRTILRNYDEAAQQYGWGEKEARNARLVTTPGPLYGRLGWYLSLHSKKCCYHDL